MEPALTSALLLDAFELPPADAIAFLESKGIKIGFNWQTAAAEAKIKAFSIAGVYRMDILQKVKDKLEIALESGSTLSDFEKSFSDEQILPKYRLDIIFQTNVQTAYMAGRYKEQIGNVKRNPYWRFRAVLDASTTPICSGLNNKVFRFDNSIWETFYPPNHFRCRSRVEVLNETEMTELGLKVINNIPEGVEQPSNGVDYNPGKKDYKIDFKKYDDNLSKAYKKEMKDFENNL